MNKSFFVVFVLFLFFLSFYADASTSTSSAVYFSQEVIAVDMDGTPYPPVKIDPQQIQGMSDYCFDLGFGRKMLIRTNIENPRSKELSQIADIVGSCCRLVETLLETRLDKGVLLYLIEVDHIPLSYSFEAAYPEGSDQWSEVRLALVRKGQPLLGKNADEGLRSLLYDTIPHELAHDALAKIPMLKHDLDGQSSFHTRWFIEGVCEYLAMTFAKNENPGYLPRFFEMRRVGSVLADPGVRKSIYSWPQRYGDDDRMMEVDLYSASLLLMIAWTEQESLPDILGKIKCSNKSICGLDLIAMMEASADRTKEEMLDVARLVGSRYKYLY